MRPDDAPPSRPQTTTQGILDVNGDGVVTAQEFADNAKSQAAKNGASVSDALAKARETFLSFDHNRDGKLDTPELDELAGNTPPQESPREPRGDEPPRGEMKGGGQRGGKQETFVALPDQPRSSDGKFMLSSPVVEDLKDLPVEFTGDGAGISPPLEWAGPPALGVTLPARGAATVTFDVAPPVWQPPGRWWALIRIGCAGRLLYTPAVTMVVR